MESGGSLGVFSGVGSHGTSSPRVVVSALDETAIVIDSSSPTATATATAGARSAGASLVRAERRAVWRAQMALVGARSGVSPSALSDAGSLIGRAAYADIVAERALAASCGYPNCGAPPASPRLQLSAREALDRETAADKASSRAAAHAAAEAVAAGGDAAGPVAGADARIKAAAAAAPTATDELSHYCSRWCWRASVFYAAQLPEAPPGARAARAAKGMTITPRIEVVPCLAKSLELRAKRVTATAALGSPSPRREIIAVIQSPSARAKSNANAKAAAAIALNLLPVVERARPVTTSQVGLPMVNTSIDSTFRPNLREAAFIIDGTRPVYPTNSRRSELARVTCTLEEGEETRDIGHEGWGRGGGDQDDDNRDALPLPPTPPAPPRIVYDEEDLIDPSKVGRKNNKVPSSTTGASSSSSSLPPPRRRKSIPSSFFAPILDASQFAEEL